MRLTVCGAADLPRKVIDLAERRVLFAMGRFDSRVRSVSVRLTDVNGPGGEIERKCVITVRLDAPKRRSIVVEDTDVDALILIDRVVDRAARAVARAAHAPSTWRVVDAGS